MSREAGDATKRKVPFIRLNLKDVLKRVSTQVEMDSKAAILPIRAEPERDDSEALCNIAICRAVLHNREAEVRCSLLETTDAIAGFDENTANVEPGKIGDAKLDQTSEGGH